MGWLADTIFGKAAPASGSLPGRVERWNNGDKTIEVPVPSEPADQGDTAATAQPQLPHDPTRNDQGLKIVPEVWVERLEPVTTGQMDRLEVWATVKNHSEFQVDITNIIFLGGSVDPSRFLRPGEAYKLKIYGGSTPKNEAYHKLELQYKIAANGDYFQADHRVDYDLEQHDGHDYFLPVKAEPLPPIRDIYG